MSAVEGERVWCDGRGDERGGGRQGGGEGWCLGVVSRHGAGSLFLQAGRILVWVERWCRSNMGIAYFDTSKHLVIGFLLVAIGKGSGPFAIEWLGRKGSGARPVGLDRMDLLEHREYLSLNNPGSNCCINLSMPVRFISPDMRIR